MAILEICYNTGNQVLVPSALQRMLDPASVASDAYLENTLIPFVPTLKQFMVIRKIPPTTQPFATIFKFILTKWLTRVLGPRPPDANVPLKIMQNAACRCRECSLVARFFVTEKQEVLSLERIGAPQRKHVEKELQKYAGSGVCQWSTISTSPQGLRVRFFFLTLLTFSMLNHCYGIDR